MKKKANSSKVSIRDIAQALGISKSAVCYALKKSPKVSQAQRERVQEMARQLGYAPDARLASWMMQVRGSAAKDLLPVAWLNTESRSNAWHAMKFLLPYLEGARECCQQLGYRLEEIWTRQPGMTMRRIEKILFQRGIEGVIVTHPARHIRLNLKYLSAISLEGALLGPRLNRVTADTNYNLLQAIKELRRLRYRRIGVCLTDQVDSFSNHTLRASVHYLNAMLPASERVEPLFHPILSTQEVKPHEVARWLATQKPDVIVAHDRHMVEWVENAGFRVPQDVGVVHLAIDDDVLEWAGIYSHRKTIGYVAAEQVIASMQMRRFGVPEAPHSTFVRGEWRHGRTVRAK
jgi:LacI family transcriptional regulator